MSLRIQFAQMCSSKIFIEKTLDSLCGVKHAKICVQNEQTILNYIKVITQASSYIYQT